jgi:isoquinoline 1-oxidoreductase alpha subunit
MSALCQKQTCRLLRFLLLDDDRQCERVNVEPWPGWDLAILRLAGWAGTGVNFARGWAPNLKFGRTSMVALAINGKSYNVDVESDTPLLWVLRDTIGLTGTKYGCGIALCGACTVHIDGVATRSCQVPVGTVGSKNVTTIEALAQNGKLHPVQKAWLDLDVPQCGYCQSGMIMAAVSLLKQKPKPTDADIDAAMTNICRCGTYQRIRAAIHAAADNA